MVYQELLAANCIGELARKARDGFRYLIGRKSRISNHDASHIDPDHSEILSKIFEARYQLHNRILENEPGIDPSRLEDKLNLIAPVPYKGPYDYCMN